MAPNQLKKKFVRAVLVSWREQPTRHDVAALQANIRRVGLVVRVRWALVVVLVVYSVIAGALYTNTMPVMELVEHMMVPALALGVVVLYNAYYSVNYRRLGAIAVWNNLQLALDALVVTVLVYFSGGVNSWFWSVFALIVFEAAFILPRSRDVWLHALLSVGLLAGVEFAEMLGLIEHVVIPFAAGDSYKDPVFVLVRYAWQAAVLLGSAWVATMLVGEFRRELESGRARTLADSETGLFNRDYFMRLLRTEVRRSLRERRELYVILIDIDRFGEFNKRFGIDVGDRLIAQFAQVLDEFSGANNLEQPTSNAAARLGGEEFAILLAERVPDGAALSCEHAGAITRELASALTAVRVDGAGVTVSVGVACMPDDGVSCAQLLDAADGALGAAIESGGNRVVLASTLAADGHAAADTESGDTETED